jgi:hypothetical protein
MRRATKRTIIGLTLVMVAAIAVMMLLFSPFSPWTSRGGSAGSGLLSLLTGQVDALQQWCGRQLLAVANDHLGPELSFERIDYAPPGTVTLTNVMLVARDARLLTAERIRIVLAETPRIGQPIVIQSVELFHPVIDVVENEQGDIIGFDSLIQPGKGRKLEDGGSTRLSDVFSIRQIKVQNAAVSYSQPNAPVMQLDGLSADLVTNPAEEREGSYTIACTIGLAPLAQLAIDGKLDIDALVLALDQFEFSAALSPGQYGMLPPSLQSVLTKHEMRGNVRASGDGNVLLRDASASDLSIDCELEDVHVVLGDVQVPVAGGKITAALGGHALSIQSARLIAYDGLINLAGRLGLTGEQEFTMSVVASNVNVEQFVTGSKEAEMSTKGLLDLDCRVTGQLESEGAEPALGGRGKLEITRAQLARVPVIDGLLRAMKRLSSYGEPTDRGSAEFELQAALLRFTRFEFISQSVAARGNGDVHFDGRLDLNINAGPLERIQGALGRVGDVFGKITDRLVTYRVTGTIDEPKYSMQPLGVNVPFIGGKDASE